VVAPRTRYAKSGDADVAYQVIGDGALDLLLFSGSFVPIDCMDEDPSMARFQRRLSSFARLIRYDRRGTGLSDRGSPSSLPTSEEVIQDAVAVLEAAGSERAALFAPFVHSVLGIMLAAKHPERVTHLVIVNGGARVLWAPDYPIGVPLDQLLSTVQQRVDSDAVQKGVDMLAMIAPSMADDQAFRAWWDRAGNLGAVPTMARALREAYLATDVRSLLPSIGLPTLILHRADIEPSLGQAQVEHGRYLAENIADAKYVELPGSDVLYWVGDTGPMLDEIEEFLTGVRGGPGAERVLSTVLFTDIVGSTDRAARLGDGRWRDVLERHDRAVRQQLARFRGREVVSTGDGFLALFDSPGRAIECSRAIRESLTALGIDVRAGIHTGEVELRGDNVAGVAVHIGARVAALADTGEILVSSSLPPLVTGSGIRFEDRGMHELKGVPGPWKVFAVQD
jgi:class 3 adenylate cyclase